MNDELRKILRLVILTIITAVSTTLSALITAAQALIASGKTGDLDPLTIKIAIAGGILAMCSSLASGLSDRPGKTNGQNHVR